MTFFYESLHIDVPVLANQQELIWINSVRTQDVVRKSFQGRWRDERDNQCDLMMMMMMITGIGRGLMVNVVGSGCPVGWGCRIHRLLLCRGVRPPNECPDMTLNNLMVRFQWCWSFGECGVPLYYHRFQVHSGPAW